MNEQKSPFELCAKQINQRLLRVQLHLKRVVRYWDIRNIDSAFESAFSLANDAEKLVLLARVLPAYTGNPRALRRMEDQILSAIPFQIGFTSQGWFAVIIPLLLPKKAGGAADYISSFLYPAMSRFFCGAPPIRYPHCVIVFRHVYDRRRPERQYRDHDNIEINRVVDVVALYVMVDDSPLRCAHYYCSAPGDTERTEVYVVPQDEFQNWLEAIKEVKENGFALSDTLG